MPAPAHIPGNPAWLYLDASRCRCGENRAAFFVDVLRAIRSGMMPIQTKRGTRSLPQCGL
jgi:hypothetical protein